MNTNRMKPHNWLFLLPLLLLVALATPARAQFIGPYLELQGGGTLPDTMVARDGLGTFNLELDKASLVGAAAGYALNPDWGLGEGRLELAYGYQTLSLSKAEFADGKVTASGDLVVQTLMLNAWAQYPAQSGWSPYLGAGVGAGLVQADRLQVTGQPLSDDDALGLAYQFGLGLDYALTRRLWLDLGYRFQGVALLEFAEVGGRQIRTQLHGHSLLLGLRVGF